MRFEASVTSISWIPSQAMSGMMKLPMDVGISHYDPPPPDRIDDLAALRDSDRFRFANHLRAAIEVEDGTVVGAEYVGGGLVGSTHVKVGPLKLNIPAVAYPEIQAEPEVSAAGVRFVQTAGGRTGAPLPRRTTEPPHLRITSPTAWTTLSLTIGLDGTSRFEVVGASPFPRHWIYDATGELSAKSGTIDFETWTHENSHINTPWHHHEAPALVAEAESAVERELSVEIMDAGKPQITIVDPDTPLISQGEEGTEVYLILDGMAEVDIDGEIVAELGPGAIVGEMAAVGAGIRTATVRARTRMKAVSARPEILTVDSLEDVARSRADD